MKWVLFEMLSSFVNRIYTIYCFHVGNRGPDGIWIWTYESAELPLDLDEKVSLVIDLFLIFWIEVCRRTKLSY